MVLDWIECCRSDMSAQNWNICFRIEIFPTSWRIDEKIAWKQSQVISCSDFLFNNSSYNSIKFCFKIDSWSCNFNQTPDVMIQTSKFGFHVAFAFLSVVFIYSFIISISIQLLAIQPATTSVEIDIRIRRGFIGCLVSISNETSGRIFLFETRMAVAVNFIDFQRHCWQQLNLRTRLTRCRYCLYGCCSWCCCRPQAWRLNWEPRSTT